MCVFPFVCCLTAMATLQSHTWTSEVKHFLLLFCVICPCFWEYCVPKIHLTRAILSRLGDCFGTPLLRRFLLLSIHNYDWQILQGWNCGIGIVRDWVLLLSSHTFRLKMAEINYIRNWRRASVRTRCVKFQSTDSVCVENCFAQVIC